MGGGALPIEALRRNHADVIRRLEAGNHRFVEIEKRLDHIDSQFELIKSVVESNRELASAVRQIPEIAASVAQTKELVEAWSTVKNVGRFTKWVAPIVAALVSAYIFIKAGLVHAFR